MVLEYIIYNLGVLGWSDPSTPHIPTTPLRRDPSTPTPQRHLNALERD